MRAEIKTMLFLLMAGITITAMLLLDANTTLADIISLL